MCTCVCAPVCGCGCGWMCGCELLYNCTWPESQDIPLPRSSLPSSPPPFPPLFALVPPDLDKVKQEPMDVTSPSGPGTCVRTHPPFSITSSSTSSTTHDPPPPLVSADSTFSFLPLHTTPNWSSGYQAPADSSDGTERVQPRVCVCVCVRACVHAFDNWLTVFSISMFIHH